MTRSGFACAFALVLLPLLLSGGDAAAGDEEMKPAYPVTARGDVVDDYHGTKVADPYRWLEDDNAPAVKAWVEEQNQLTFSRLEKIPFRQAMRRRLEEIFNYPRFSSPFRAGSWYFFSKNDGLQPQSVVYYQKGLDGEPQVFIDPNTLSADGTVAVNLAGESQDNRYMAISRAEAGSDWQEMRVVEIATRRELPDRIRWVKFSGAAWHGDGFFYSGYTAPQKGQELTARSENQKIFYHRLGDPQEKDRLVYEDPKHPQRYLNTGISEDGRWQFLGISEGTSGNEIWFRDLTAGDETFKPLVQGFDGDSNPVDVVDGRFLLLTNIGAPNNRLVSVDPADPARDKWTTLVAEKPEPLRSASSAGGKLFLSYMKDVVSRVYQCDLAGKVEKEIPAPALGTMGGFYGKRDEKVLFYTFTSFTYPPTIYRYDLETGRSEVFRRAEVRFDPEAYVTRQVFYESKDGTRVPMFIVHRKGMALDGKNPTYLYAYGGFQASMLPAFSPTRIALLENGVVYAVANIRGGGEYGEAWHRAGMLEKKQNVFDDFIGAAEWLISHGYTRPERLAISGGSNGGLLVGAMLTQRAELCRAVVCWHPLLDMLRYHRTLMGPYWISEYGSADVAEQFPYLYAYSPYHHVRRGVKYPATLFITGDGDTRVDPMHARKMTALLQAVAGEGTPILLQYDLKSGHVGGNPVSKSAADAGVELGFLMWQLGMDYAPPLSPTSR